MKNHLRSVGIGLALLATTSISCKSTSASDGDSNSLGGDINVPVSQVGNQISFGTLTIGTNSYGVNASVTVTKNTNGVATMHVVSDVPNSPQLQTLLNRIPISVINSSGKIDAEFKWRATSEGMQDYFNIDGKPQTLVKYAANVGDKYTLTKSDGTKITRTVTQKSTTDDFPYGLYLIKVITVEQDSRIPGVSKLIYKFNHVFGLVYVEVLLEDGSRISSYLYSQNT